MTDTVGRRRINAIFLSIGSEIRHHPVGRSPGEAVQEPNICLRERVGSGLQRLRPQPHILIVHCTWQIH